MIGHDNVRALLERDLPPVTLLRGPTSVGKWTLALHLADHHRVGTADRLIVAEPLTAERARNVVAFAALAPFGTTKLAILNVDTATEIPGNILLKTLEEPPAATKFILVASGFVMPTVSSRAQTFWLGLLTDEQVRQVYLRQSLNETAAHRAALAARGQVTPPPEAKHKAVVVDLMAAVARRDPELFEQAMSRWADPCQGLLFRYLVEALTKEWSLYEESDTQGLHRRPSDLRRILLTLSQVSHAQARLGVRAALSPFVAGG